MRRAPLSAAPRGPHRRAVLAALLLLLACGGPPPAPPPVDAAATIARIADMPEGDQRRALVASLRRLPADQVHPLLVSGFASQLPGPRVAAILVAGRRRDGARFTAELLAAAADPTPAVRVAAARALGSLRVSEAFPALEPNLSHETVSVRLSALRALARIDPDRAAALPELARLQLDPDRAVADTATKVARKLITP